MFSSVIIIPLLIVWFVVVSKSILFWIYLWQLKEYHIGRFLDHFRTTKGKKLLFNVPVSLKVFFLFLIAAIYIADIASSPAWFYNSGKGFIFLSAVFLLASFGLLFLYYIQFIKITKDYLKRNIKKPVLTFKTMLLFSVSLFFSIIFLLIFFDNIFLLIVYDLLIPVIVSAIVLIFQPFFVIARNRILKKAKKKISGFKDLTVIGITGSYGKTSTKEFLKTILSEKFNVLATSEHKNSEMGIAQTILGELNENHEVFIVEMGAYKKSGISLLCDIVKPRIGIVTGVNEQHLALFGSMENLLSAEGGGELVKSLPKDGLLVVNGDNKHCLNLYKNIERSEPSIGVKLYSVNKNKVDADIWAEEVEVKKDSLSFVAITKKKDMAHFEVSVSGRQNIQNLLGAILTAKELGMSFDEISKACGKIIPGQGRMTMKKGAFGINVIDSSYSSNPDGVIADLDYLKTFEGKKAVVMPCLIELGAKSADVHRQIGAKIADVCDMVIITTKDKFEEIKIGAIQNGMALNPSSRAKLTTGQSKIIFCENPKEIFNLITTFCKENDSVLLEGRVPKELINLLTTK